MSLLVNVRNLFFALILILSACSGIKKEIYLAKKGDSRACYNMVSYYIGHRDYHPPTKKQEQKIVEYCKRGLLDTLSEERAFFYLEQARYTDKKMEKYMLYQKAAIEGNGEAQWAMALYYLEGKNNGRIDADSGLYWMSQCAYGNVYKYAAVATEYLGDTYREGKIVKQDTIRALYYYKRACACFGLHSRGTACDNVLEYYKLNSSLKDSSEVQIYQELRTNRVR